MNPSKVPADWVKVVPSAGLRGRHCNHVGMIELYDEVATCINCLAQWTPPDRRSDEQPRT